MSITIFKSIGTTNAPFYKSLDFALSRIRDGHQKELIQKIRLLKTKAERNILKKNLQCILFSGEFRSRNIKGLEKHSGLICLDFDGFKSSKEMASFKQFAVSNPFTHVLFVSPSGNGFKLIVKIPTTSHLGSFLALHQYYIDAGWEDEFDTSTKDVCRICYHSYDPDIVYNKESELFDAIREPDMDLTKPTNALVSMKNENDIIENLIKWWDKKYGFIDGEKNNNLFILANSFNQFGVDQITCERYFLANYYQPPCKDPSEITGLIKNAYKDVGHFNTKSFEDKDAVLEIERLAHKGTSVEKISKKTGVSIEDIEDVIDNSEKNVFWEKNKKGGVTTTMLSYKYFLENNGFYKYKSEASSEFVFVRVKNNLIENTTEVDIKNFVLNYLEQVEDKSIYQHFASKNSYHFTEGALNMISNVLVNLRLDSKNVGYVFYNNTAVKVTRTEVKLVDYIDLDGAVWKSHVIDRDFKPSKDIENEYKQFVSNISKNGREDVLLSSESALGYLMHNNNDRKTQKAIILNDSKQGGGAENGGIGKGLYIQGVGQIRRTIVEDGKDFDDSGTFKYQRVGLDTQVFCFDDVPRDFKFEKLFSIITEGMTVTKKRETSVKLKYEDSPKIAITTNYVIKGKGNSHDRRKFEIEFGEFYGAHLTPAQDFGHELFNDWSKEHYNRFDNYMVSLIQRYMVSGLISSVSDTADERRLLAQTDPLFVEWFNECVSNYEDVYTNYLTLMETCAQESGIYKINFRDFRSWMEDYCDFHNWEVSIKRPQNKMHIRFRKKNIEYIDKPIDGAFIQ
tara:strand:- start:1655 stop:4033 length:2379 start_codon:yes stop_codon:yes gene_type:complete